MNAKIYLSVDNSLLGTADVDPARYAEHCPDPDGHIRSDDILDLDDRARLNLTGRESVYAIAT